MAKHPAAPKPTCGRMVHYVLPGGPTAGEHRPAVVLETGRPNGLGDWEAHLHVHLKPLDDPGLVGVHRFEHLVYVQSVEPDNSGVGTPKLGTWHWPERENSDDPKPTGMAKHPAAPKPTCGRMVHYVLPGGPTAGEHRPAVVLETGRPNGLGDWEAHLHVHLKPLDDPGLVGVHRFEHLVYVQSVEPDNSGVGTPKLGTWHWPERENSDDPKPTR